MAHQGGGNSTNNCGGALQDVVDGGGESEKIL